MLLDTAAMYFRAFYGVPDSVKAPDGSPINAVRGLLDAIAKLVTTYRPTRLIACWDDDWRPAWRVDLIPSYKTHRVVELVAAGPDVEEVPDLLSPQVPVIVEALTALGIPIVGATGYEADDVIGTLATTATGPVDIVTSDRDLFQLVDDERGVRVINTARGMSNIELVTEAVVEQRYGIRARQYADFATLRGDPSDGLPGVAGIGEKTAAALLREYQDLEGLVAAAADPSSSLTKAQRAKIDAAADYLLVAPTVVKVARDLDLDVTGSDGRLRGLGVEARAAVTALAERWGLGSSVERAVAALDGAADA
ncbi:flap endonuclease [Cnuibacter physcomitrellae]|uniref:5'-3' exonuclease n=1 Tax=Cnuibacter physcomitrellae TaxID=1619308 RepID=A0A1X9LQ72_9MICO|nr:5'-3' exonuclease [Cnuibacter physcomitrellae]ARJ07267.1 flap endonuclease [Cnuibacter physcomitrellae]MCS5498844.1 5'-3' exonuclease [Cnuibacter physcomitrellae]